MLGVQRGGVARLSPACRRVLCCSERQLPEETSRDAKRSFSPQRSAQTMAQGESAVQRRKVSPQSQLCPCSHP